MGQRIINFDDLDGTDGLQDETIARREFSAGKVGWEMDLTDKNWQRLLDALAPFTEKAKKVRGPGIKAAKDPAAPVAAAVATIPDPGTAAHVGERFLDRAEPARLAQWAAKHRVLVARPGRPPREVLAAFRADNPDAVPAQYRQEAATA